MAILHKLYWASDLVFKIHNEDVDDTYDADNDEYDDDLDNGTTWGLHLLPPPHFRLLPAQLTFKTSTLPIPSSPIVP